MTGTGERAGITAAESGFGLEPLDWFRDVLERAGITASESGFGQRPLDWIRDVLERGGITASESGFGQRPLDWIRAVLRAAVTGREAGTWAGKCGGQEQGKSETARARGPEERGTYVRFAGREAGPGREANSNTVSYLATTGMAVRSEGG